MLFRSRRECAEFKKHKEEAGLKDAKKRLEDRGEIAPPTAPQEKETQPPPPDDLSPRQKVAMYGLPELEKLKRDTLQRFLTSAPQVGAKVATWILDQWDLDPNVRADPNDLHNLLRDAAVPANIAFRAVNLVTSLDEEMRDVLEQRERPYTRPRLRTPYRREPYDDYSFSRDRGRGYPEDRYERFPEREPRRVRPGVEYLEDQDYYRPPSTYGPRDDIAWRIEKEVEKATKPLMDRLDKIADDLKESRKPQQEQNMEIGRAHV